jgi:hypothetical protein
MLPGEKAKLVNLLDNVQAEKAELTTTYSIEIVFAMSPIKRVKCGAIAVFKLNDLDVDIADKQIEQKMKDAANELTQTLYQDPEYFKQTDGRWIPWAIDRSLTLYDKFGSADITIKAPKLRIRHKLTPSMINTGRADPKKLFEVAFLIDQLLDGNFNFDPWRGVNRRGIIGADK